MSEWFEHEPYIPSPSSEVSIPKEVNMNTVEDDPYKGCAEIKLKVNDDCGYPYIDNDFEKLTKKVENLEDSIVKMGQHIRHLEDKEVMYQITCGILSVLIIGSLIMYVVM